MPLQRNQTFQSAWAAMDTPDFGHSPTMSDAWTMDPQEQEERRWMDLLAQVSAEVSGPLTSSMERISALLTTGSIDSQSVRALRGELDRARSAGMIGQQLARLASRRLKQHPERVALTQMLRDVLLQRARETQARGVQLKQLLQPIEVVVDPSLLFSLLNTVLDWVLDCARSHIEFRIDMKTWPAYGRLTCRFVHQPLDELDDRTAAASSSTAHLDSLTWRLAQQTAQTMGLKIDRQDEMAATTLTIEFPRTDRAGRSRRRAGARAGVDAVHQLQAAGRQPCAGARLAPGDPRAGPRSNPAHGPDRRFPRLGG